MNALDEVPVMSTEKFRKVAKMLFAFANELSEKAFYNLQLKQESSEREKAFDLLKKSEEKFRNVFAYSANGKSITTIGGKMKANNAFCQILGYTEDELNQMKWQDITHTESVKNDQRILKSILSGEETSARWEKRYIHKNGSIVWTDISTTLHRDSAGNPLYFITSISDITAKKHVEDLLRDNESFLQEAQTIANLGAYNLDVKTGLWTSSALLDEIFGIGPDYVRSVEGWLPIIHPDWRETMMNYLLNEVLGNRTIFDKEYQIVRQNDKAVRWVHGRGRLKIDENNQVISMLGTIQDITERKAAEILLNIKNEELLHAKEKAEESDRLKSSFLANMSHEIRTPLNSIIGFSELLNDQYFTEEQRAEFTRTIVDQGNNLLIIINDIMDLSMLESKQIILRKEKFTVSKLLNELFYDFKTSAEVKGIDFQVNIPSGCESIFLENDTYRIKQILNNFISNALKFTSQGYVLIGCSCNNDIVEFYVKDNGIGIPAKYHDSIFERFRQLDNTRTRKYGGNGLGLAISKNVAEILGGKIRVESEEGKGSTFYFTLPEYKA